ncbi:MAG TPA: type II secretion system F family protein, partial [Allosphingosinicella sp.]|nr:type II secretion system F family protein [Allosphingosinicella sp.]
AFVPTTAVRLIQVGERSGQLADTCARASQIMGEAARARIDRIVSLANPIAIVTLGGIVAMLVAGVMLGIFSLGDFAG